jgi:mono/diheme cytochrome c family protein
MKQSTQKLASGAQEIKNPKEIGFPGVQEEVSMRRLLVVAVVVLAASFAAFAVAGDAAAGKAVFDGAKPACKTCHTDAKNPLAKAGAENSADELKAWVRTPKEMIAKKGKKGVMPAYAAEKVSDADLENLVAYLATLK